MSNPSITISSFEVSGNQKTQIGLFENEFAKSCKSSNFRELANQLTVAVRRMEEMDIFKSVDAQVKILSEEKDHSIIAVNIVVKEKNMPSLKVGIVLNRTYHLSPHVCIIYSMYICTS